MEVERHLHERNFLPPDYESKVGANRYSSARLPYFSTQGRLIEFDNDEINLQN